MYKINLNTVHKSKSVATIGNFDGLHLGHIRLLDDLNLIAKEYDYRRLLVTFEPLPQEYFCDRKNVNRFARLSLLRDKVQLLKKDNLVDELIIMHFNQSIANLTPSQFIDHILINKLNVAHLVVGHDFKFGKNGSGTITDLTTSGIIVNELDPFIIKNQRVSSSLLRQLASENQLDQIQQFLGRNIQYTSRIIRGKQLGRKLGFPTINLSLGKNKPALWGIYTAFVYIDGIRYNAVASIGKNPTVSNSNSYKLEAHLLDIDLDLYGKIACVEILSFIRFEQKFPNLDSLITQMQQDLLETRNYFKNIIKTK